MQIKRWSDNTSPDMKPVKRRKHVSTVIPFVAALFAMLALVSGFLVGMSITYKSISSATLKIDATAKPVVRHTVTPTSTKKQHVSSVVKTQKKPPILTTVRPKKHNKHVLPPYLRDPTQEYNGHSESGEDFGAGYHSDAVALWSGTVFKAYRTCWNTDCSSTSGGVVIIVADVPGYGMQSTYYLHLDVAYVVAGQSVQKGDTIGLTGGQVGFGNWPTSQEFSSGPHIEIGSCAYFLPCPVGYNFNPASAIQQVIDSWDNAA